MTSYAAVDLIAQRTANTTEQDTAHTAEAPVTRRVEGRGRRFGGWSFRFGALHQSCACTHRHRMWFLFPVPMVGLQASQFGTAPEIPPRELPIHRHVLTYFSGGSIINTPAATFWLVCFKMEPNPSACKKRSTERSLSARCALGAR